MKWWLPLILLLIYPAFAHDSWISNGNYRNWLGELCCGYPDCSIVNAQHVTLPTNGYRLTSGEFILQSETQPSGDGKYWLCKHPSGKRRCFFAPPEGY